MDTSIIIGIIIAVVVIAVVWILRDRMTELYVNGQKAEMKAKMEAKAKNSEFADEKPVNIVFKGNKLRGEGEYRMQGTDFSDNDVDGKQKLEEALVSILWAAAIPHFFDEKILAALRPELADQAEGLYADLQELTFVEEFPGHGYNIHELTREVLLSQLWQQNRAEFLLLSKRAADYFFALGASSEEDVEFCYHEILNEGETQTGRLLDRATDWWTYYQIERIQAALQGFGEHEQADRVDSFGRGFVLHLNGLIKRRSGNYAEAESIFNRAQAIYDDDIEIKNPRYITTLLRDLSNSKGDQGNYKSAVGYSEQALKICEEQLGENHLDTASSLNNLVLLYQDLGQYKEVEPLFLRALKIREEQLGENHPNTATSLGNLALLYQDLGRYQEAEPLYLRALKICEEQLGENHPDTATSLGNLALLYQAQKRYQEAEPLYLRSLKIKEEQLGENHPDTASSLNNLALLYQEQKRYQEAKQLLLRALKIREEQLGENHPDKATSLNNLASLYQDLGRYQEAEPLYLRALKICEEQLGENHPDTTASLGNLALLYQAQKRYQEAIPLLERWKSIKQDRQETNNPSFANGVRILGKLYEKCQQFPQAVQTTKKP